MREVEALRREHRTVAGLTLSEQPVALPQVGGAAGLDFDIETGTADQLQIALTDGLGYQTLIGVTPKTNEVFIDRTRSGPHFHDAFPDRHVAPVDLRALLAAISSRETACRRSVV